MFPVQFEYKLCYQSYMRDKEITGIVLTTKVYYEVRIVTCGGVSRAFIRRRLGRNYFVRVLFTVIDPVINLTMPDKPLDGQTTSESIDLTSTCCRLDYARRCRVVSLGRWYLQSNSDITMKEREARAGYPGLRT